MQVKLRTTLASPKLTASAGSVVDVDDAMAESLIDGGYADLIEDRAERVAVMADDGERAVAPKGKRK